VSHAFSIDPYEVLGVTSETPLDAIRDAYRSKSKRYHPDVGGDAWAFRILTHSYEVLSARRVAARAEAEAQAHSPAPAPPRPPATPPPFVPKRPFDPDAVGRKGRPGQQDDAYPPERLVEVEVLLLRYEHDDPLAMMLEAPEDRNLSCTLNLLWPRLDSPDPTPEEFPTLRTGVENAFHAVAIATHPTGRRVRTTSRGRTAGLLGYPTAQAAADAVSALRTALHRAGLGLVETIREVTVPRDWV
jgi:hypothetical protein